MTKPENKEKIATYLLFSKKAAINKGNKTIPSVLIIGRKEIIIPDHISLSRKNKNRERVRKRLKVTSVSDVNINTK